MMTSRFPAILLLNLAGAVLFLSWYPPAQTGFWFTLDAGIFHFFNHLAATSHSFLWFLAITNNRAFDGCSLLAMGLLLLWYWRKATPPGRRHIIIMGIVMLLSAVVLNQLGHLLPVSRPSPTLTFEDSLRVGKMVGISTKDASTDSFPGDHGMMLLIFAGFMWRYFGAKAFGLGLLIFCIFALPRMMIGAHWFTDIAVGSLSIVFIGLPWILLTPLSDKIITWLNNHLPGKKTTNS
ncbi:phosphatase PAP2 family protein [Cronobacter sakazakii]|uniref:phosphatase PAP2 family protein n=1 Tax=Cronobacter sakazakii TaxID=28141 RepID=UPI0006D16C30|nr:phosphatase PAP2 family protein [Cronobacter sakazakii]EGT5762981.1 phosphatase PAP2 family protein [Cronobacter sakazakii]EIX1614494.1 phosphatase PAP2 family protein [Cronobacter sakazakii]EJG0760988.1 phosphatase PAP2 family protein [Cronobacter sakazakii]EJJ0660783.1 phosphatase PAP2 family protein [Cronobacter sakazakii]EJJ0670280.1 phosphatase PAP2 family protein [Cronobacter sakazakii]